MGNKMANDKDVQRENDPEDEPEAEPDEEEEEVDIVDPVEELREACGSSEQAQRVQQILETCTERVNSRSNTAETCHEELIDYLQIVDSCVSKTLFHKLK
ncbi:cytochrome b-c1 complex subunit 6, mitochondrial-like [Mya arenaria]|uniref:cytochrome b-c1 complex subunit 6, mitochondrial-like n=1 Tax=Mya arenaria TaxID=6604 RepID=UPI0022E03147|nr:cytochrome b-c1 complex subunit 6, mitochondrial-like [Mya arenaria]